MYFVIAAIVVLLLLIIISEVFFGPNKRKPEGFTLDGILFHLSWIFVILAILMPFIIRWWYKRSDNYGGLVSLGPVGDFLSGSTMAFFNLASISLLVATILIQRKELKESQKEYKVTNETMKKQQFESTFFNMINLHHNILKDIELENHNGRLVINDLYNKLRTIYHTDVFSEFKDKFIGHLANTTEIDTLNKITEKLSLDVRYHGYLKEESERIYYKCGMDNTIYEIEWAEFMGRMEKGADIEWALLKKRTKEHFENIKNDRDKCKELLTNLLDIDLICSEKELPEQLLNFREKFFQDPSYELKFSAYEKLYKKHENEIGHYYRNLYRIVKLIQTNAFGNDNEKDNEEEKRKYRGILRAQLSSFELLMIFYNVVYSEKGKKFKDLLLNINFFDDHLVKEDFIWINDNEELLKLDPSKI